MSGELTKQELIILKHICNGDEEIAKKLGLSKHTIRTHINNINMKCNSKSKANTLGIALKREIIKLNDLIIYDAEE